MNFVSGLESTPRDARVATDAGGSLGIRINKDLSEQMTGLVVEQTKAGKKVFIEHGLYKPGQMEKERENGFASLTKRVNDLIEAGADPKQLVIVLPDMLDNQGTITQFLGGKGAKAPAPSAFVSFEALQTFITELPSVKGVTFMHVLQREKPGGKFQWKDEDGNMVHNMPDQDAYRYVVKEQGANLVLGIPGNLSRVDGAELNEMFQTGVIPEYWQRFHLLGVDPGSDRGKELIKVIRTNKPDAIVSTDTALARTASNKYKARAMQSAAEELGLTEDLGEEADWGEIFDMIFDQPHLGLSRDLTRTEAKNLVKGFDLPEEVAKELLDGKSLNDALEAYDQDFFAVTSDYKLITQKIKQVLGMGIARTEEFKELIERGKPSGKDVLPEPPAEGVEAPYETRGRLEPVSREDFKKEYVNRSQPALSLAFPGSIKVDFRTTVGSVQISFEPSEAKSTTQKIGRGVPYQHSTGPFVPSESELELIDNLQMPGVRPTPKQALTRVLGDQTFDSFLDFIYDLHNLWKKAEIEKGAPEPPAEPVSKIVPWWVSLVERVSKQKLSEVSEDDLIDLHSDEDLWGRTEWGVEELDAELVRRHDAKNPDAPENPSTDLEDPIDTPLDELKVKSFWENEGWKNILKTIEKGEDHVALPFDLGNKVIGFGANLRILKSGLKKKNKPMRMVLTTREGRIKVISHYPYGGEADAGGDLLAGKKKDRETFADWAMTELSARMVEKWIKYRPGLGQSPFVAKKETEGEYAWTSDESEDFTKFLEQTPASKIFGRIIREELLPEIEGLAEAVFGKHGTSGHRMDDLRALLRRSKDLRGGAKPETLSKGVKEKKLTLKQMKDGVAEVTGRGGHGSDYLRRLFADNLKIDDYSLRLDRVLELGEYLQGKQAPVESAPPEPPEPTEPPAGPTEPAFPEAIPPREKFEAEIAELELISEELQDVIDQGEFPTQSIGDQLTKAMGRVEEAYALIGKTKDWPAKIEEAQDMAELALDAYDEVKLDKEDPPPDEAKAKEDEEIISSAEDVVLKNDEAFQKARSEIRASTATGPMKSRTQVFAIQKKYVMDRIKEALATAPKDMTAYLKGEDQQKLKDFEYKIRSAPVSKKMKIRDERNALLTKLMATGKFPIVRIDVPGRTNGLSYRIFNTQESLKAFEKKMDGMRFVKLSSAVSGKPGKPTPFPSVSKKKGPAKTVALELFVTGDKSKEMLLKPVIHNGNAVATDGQRIAILFGHKENFPVLKADMKLPNGAKYPDYNVVIPSAYRPEDMMISASNLIRSPDEEYVLDLETLHRWTESALIPGKEKSAGEREDKKTKLRIPSTIAFHLGTDGQLAVRSSESLQGDQMFQFNSTNHDPHADDMFVMDALHLNDVLKLASALREDHPKLELKVRFPSPEQGGLFLFTGTPATASKPVGMVLQMPINTGGVPVTGYLKEEMQNALTGNTEAFFRNTARGAIRRYNQFQARTLWAKLTAKRPGAVGPSGIEQPARPWDEREMRKLLAGKITPDLPDHPQLSRDEVYELFKAFTYLRNGEGRKEWVPVSELSGDFSRHLNFYANVHLARKEAGVVSMHKAMQEMEKIYEAHRLIADKYGEGVELLAGGFLKKISEATTAMPLRGIQVGDPANNPADRERLVVLAQSLRNPHYEFSHLIGIKNGKIAKTETMTLGMPNQAPAGGAQLLRGWGLGMDQVIAVHNHPSGDPTPSPSDMAVSLDAGLKYENYGGSLVLDHGEFAWIGNSETANIFRDPTAVGIEIGEISEISTQTDFLKLPDQPHPIIGERLTQHVDLTSALNRWGKDLMDLGSENPQSISVFWLDNKQALQAVTRHDAPVSPETVWKFVKDLETTSKPVGSVRPIVYLPVINEMTTPIRQALAGKALDVVIEGFSSDLRQGDLRQGVPSYESDLVMEEGDPVPAGDEPIDVLNRSVVPPTKSEFEFIDSDGNKVKYEFNLEAIPPIKLPELVKFYKMLMGGEVPQVTGKLGIRNAWGVFWQAGPLGHGIKINPKIYAMPQDQALKTLAHEIGHFIDFLDEGSLKRGNLIGRLTSAHKNKAKSMPAFMDQLTDGSFKLDQKQRSKIRYQATKQIKFDIGVEFDQLRLAHPEVEIPEDLRADPASPKASSLEQYAHWLTAKEDGPRLLHGSRQGEILRELEDRLKKESKKRYQEMLGAEFEKMGMIEESALRAELITLMDWWKPIPKDAPPSFIKYRESAVELYADTMSILLVAPAELQARAPIFWKGFWGWLEKKPALKAKLGKLKEALISDKPSGVILKRLEAERRGYKSADERFLVVSKAVSDQYEFWREFRKWIKIQYYDSSAGIKKYARTAKEKLGAEYKWHEDPEVLWDEMPFANNAPHLWLEKVHREIVQKLPEAGLSVEHLGQYLTNTRILNENFENLRGRSQVANPGGVDARNAQQNLMVLTKELGIDKMQTLEHFASRLRDAFFGIYKDFHRLGMISDQVFNDQIAPNKNNYATFAVLDHFMETAVGKGSAGYIPAGLKKSYGTHKDIINPVSAMTLKGMIALKAIAWQEAKLSAVKLLQRYFPNEIEELDFTMVGNDKGPEYFLEKKYSESAERQLATNPDKGLITLMVRGKLVKYVVPREVSIAQDGYDPTRINWAFKVLNASFRRIFYPFFITYNPGFQWLWSPIRDFNRNYMNTPNRISRSRMIKAYMQGWRESVMRMEGNTPPIIKEMMSVGAIGTPFDNFSERLYDDPDGIFELMIQKSHLRPQVKRNKIVRALTWLPRQIQKYGQVFETLAKVAPYKILTRDLGVSPDEAGEFVRNHTGVPAWWKKGTKVQVMSAFFPFLNVAMKGYADDLRLAFGRRKGLAESKGAKRIGGLGPLTALSTRTGRLGQELPGRIGGRERQGAGPTSANWWGKYARSGGLWTMLKSLATAGIFGTALKKAFDLISDYDKKNYHCIPTGYTWVDEDNVTRVSTLWDDQIPESAKVVYWRIPMDETQKLISGVQHFVTQKILSEVMDKPALGVGAGMSDLTGWASGQLPGLHPLIKMGFAWGQYAGGENPRDSFYGSNILTSTEDKARNWAGTKKMIGWTYDQTGLGNFFRYDPETDTMLEFVTKNVPLVSGVLGKILKVSDAGRDQEAYALMDVRDRDMARYRTQYGDATQEMYKEYNRLSQMGTEIRNPQQDEQWWRVKDWHTAVYGWRWDQIKFLHNDSINNLKSKKSANNAEIQKLIREMEEDTKAWK